MYNELDSYFIKKYLRQDLQDLQDGFSFIPPSYLKKLVVADKQETGNVKENPDDPVNPVQKD